VQGEGQREPTLFTTPSEAGGGVLWGRRAAHGPSLKGVTWRGIRAWDRRARPLPPLLLREVNDVVTDQHTPVFLRAPDFPEQTRIQGSAVLMD